MNCEVKNDNILVRVPEARDEYKTQSGIWLMGVEHDFLVAEVVLTPSLGGYYYTGGYNGQEGRYKKDSWVPFDIKAGDVVVLERNFHHIYDATRRDRVDHTFRWVEGGDSEYDYFITKYEDVYWKYELAEGETIKDIPHIHGELFSIMQPKQVARVGS